MSDLPDSREPTVASRVVFRGRLAALRVDDVRMPSGRISRREIVEHGGAAAVVPVTADDEVVLVRQYRKAVEADLLEIPAGTLEPGESAEGCAHRELREETGLRASLMNPLLTFIPSPGLLTEQITIFVARGLRPVEETIEIEEEDLRTVRVPLSQVSDLIARGEIRDAKSLIGLLLVAPR